MLIHAVTFSVTHLWYSSDRPPKCPQRKTMKEMLWHWVLWCLLLHVWS